MQTAGSYLTTRPWHGSRRQHLAALSNQQILAQRAWLHAPTKQRRRCRPFSSEFHRCKSKARSSCIQEEASASTTQHDMRSDFSISVCNHISTNVAWLDRPTTSCWTDTQYTRALGGVYGKNVCTQILEEYPKTCPGASISRNGNGVCSSVSPQLRSIGGGVVCAPIRVYVARYRQGRFVITFP